jgi:PAS domain S-box-containing protein
MLLAMITLLLGGSALLYITVRSLADSYQSELTDQLRDGLDSLVVTLAEQAVVGDYATIQQMLEVRVKRKNLFLLKWEDSSGRTIVAGSLQATLEAPLWFSGWIGLPRLEGAAPLEVGGQSYGKVTMLLSTTPSVNYIWQTFLRQLEIVVLGGLAFLVLSGLLLKLGLQPLYRLAHGARRFGQGDYSVRIEARGVTELLPSIHAFNDMAVKIEGLLDSQRKLSRAVEQSANIVVITNRNGDIEYINPKFSEITGYAEAEVIGKNPRILKSGETSLEEYQRMWNTITNGGEWRGEFHNRRKDGSLYWENASIAPVKNEKGEIIHFVAVKEDITRRKAAEEALLTLNETLEQRVREEVAKNREKDHLLIRQSRLASMGEMIGNIAHQWRQPLNALGLVLSNIQDAYAHNELDQPLLDESVATGERLIGKMSATIDDFRNFFKPDREKIPFNLAGTVRDALTVIDSSFKGNRIKVVLNVEHDATVLGFPNEYAQVVLNILGNAKDAIHAHNIADGKVEIDIGRDGDQAYVAIRDNGGGIPLEIQEKIFDPYFTTRDKGTGIGLYMSKMIIENNMNGRIEVCNIGEGAEFKIYTPLPAAASGG